MQITLQMSLLKFVVAVPSLECQSQALLSVSNAALRSAEPPEERVVLQSPGTALSFCLIDPH